MVFVKLIKSDGISKDCLRDSLPSAYDEFFAKGKKITLCPTKHAAGHEVLTADKLPPSKAKPKRSFPPRKKGKKSE